MAYLRPTLEEFVAVFPSFAAVTQAQYDFWVARAERIITGCFGEDQVYCTMLLTAHYLTLAGIGAGAESEMAAQGASSFTRIKSGTIELERGAPSSSGASMGEYGKSSYGQMLWPFLRACFGGPLVTATGTLGCVGSFQSGPLPWQ